MKHRAARLTAAALAMLLLAAPAALAPAPAAAQFGDAAALGRQEHPKVVAQFGGEYHDPAVRKYVRGIGERLLRHTEMAGARFTFTVLNSDIVNAFALPGGYVYVTRGLMALADNEAELAGVLAHEIGHVTAKHGEQRLSRTFWTQLGLGLLGSVVDSGFVNNLLQYGALAVLQGYSREQEFEADTLGVRYMTAAGYDPQFMTLFLAKLKAERELAAALAGQAAGSADQFNILATHPRTTDRVERAVREVAKTVPPVAKPRIGISDYMRAIDGMYYDGDPENGLVKGRRFIHPKLRFAFEVPQGFSILNNADSIIGLGPGDARIIFDLARRPDGVSLAHYVRGVWGTQLPLSAPERIVVDGIEGATAVARVKTQSGAKDLRLVALQYEGPTVARFMFVVPPRLSGQLDGALRRTIYSYRRLGAERARAARPFTLRTTRVKPGQTVKSFAARLPFPSHREARFRVLNGLALKEELEPGWWIKTVRE